MSARNDRDDHDDDDASIDADDAPVESGGGCLLVLGTLLFLAITVIPLGFAVVKFHDGWRAAAALRTLADDEAGKGRAIVVRGKIRGDATNGPERAGAAAWIGEVGQWRKSGKSSKYHVLCTVTRVDGVQVEAASTTFSLAGFDGHALSLAHGLALARGQVAVDLLSEAWSSGGVPDDVMKVCDLSGPYSYVYAERTIRAGQDVVVRACRTNETLHACGDGIDFVTARATSDIARDTKDAIALPLLIATFLALLGLGVSGAMAAVKVSGKKKKNAGAR